MRRAWACAAQENFDAYVWLNDDTWLLPGALETLRHTAGDKQGWARGEGTNERTENKAGAVVVGSTRDPDTGRATYGERGPSGRLSPPGERARLISWSFNGNLVWVTREAYQELGNLSPEYRHSFGDIDYGVRARRAGIPVVLAPGFLGECRGNGAPKWQRADVPLADRWRALRGPKGISARQLRHLMRVQRKGVWWLSMARLYCIAVAPRWFARGNHSS
jgi:GT2 family glycosyltransferase